MRHFPTLLSHELRMLLVSPATYVAATLFLGFMGLVFTKILELYGAAPQETSPAIVYFQLFWLPVCVMVPLLTMKCLAEERRLGTIETLLTTPVTTTEVVLAKFGAAYALYTTLWGSTVVFFWVLRRFSGDERFLDSGPLLGGYLFIAVSGLLFVALGVLASSSAAWRWRRSSSGATRSPTPPGSRRARSSRCVRRSNTRMSSVTATTSPVA